MKIFCEENLEKKLFNYLCPVCKARLNTASDLELHYATIHSSSASARSTDVNVDSLMQELNELNSSLNEERYVGYNFIP